LTLSNSDRTNAIISAQTRWLAIITGCLAAVVGMVGFGPLFVAVPGFLIVGASIQPRFPRAGRGLICAGALWLTFWVFDIGTLIFVDHGARGSLPVSAVSFALVLVVVFSDVAIIMEEVKIRRRVHKENVSPGGVMKP
jgi:hypothetical protein